MEVCRTTRAPLLLALGYACACDGAAPPPVAPHTSDVCDDPRTGTVCDDGLAYVCADGALQRDEDCAADARVCVPGLGCRVCVPDEASCRESVLYRCSPDGTERVLEVRCEAPEVCTPSGCRDLCGEARTERSYLGCRYFAALPLNTELDPSFTPALVIGNPSPVSAHVRVTQGDALVAEEDVLPGGTAAVPVAFHPALAQRARSVIARGAAYELRSDVPVTVQQWSPLEFGGACSDVDGGTSACGSVTNDVSLLLPSEALARDDDAELRFLVATRPTFALRSAEGVSDGRSGFVLVIGASDEPAHVRVLPRAQLAPSGAGEESIGRGAVGEPIDVLLARGDVLQLLSDPGAPCAEPPVPIQNGARSCRVVDGYDLSGTEIASDAPIAVIAGHDCTNVPFARPACDHLEESLLPVDTWGRRVYATRPISSRSQSFLVQVISAQDDNRITVTPGDGGVRRLARGESFVLESDVDLAFEGSGPIAAVVYMEGQGDERWLGDPSMTVAVPVEQWRSAYVFLTPATYRRSYATLTAAPDTEFVLDGEPLAPRIVGDAFGLGAYTVILERAGAHTLRSVSGARFGLQLSGVAAYTSYLCPGGLDLEVEPPPL